MSGGRHSRGAMAVIGAGSWGTALALELAGTGQDVILWGRDPRQVASMRRERANSRYLPGIPFHAALEVTDDPSEALAGGREVLVCVPSQAFRSVLELLVARRPGLDAVAWATKGFEPESGRLLEDVVHEVLGARVRTAVLSGPSFAMEVAKGLPTAVTLASRDEHYARALAARFQSATFRVYTNEDMTGVQICGGVKNVLAIASGIADGLGFGANARAALVTRGLAELSRLGVSLGGRPATFTGLAGLGDLLLTCTDDQSRNRRFGLALARGRSPQQAERELAQVVEGSRNTREVNRLAAQASIDMPIARQVERVLFEGVAPRAAVQALMARDPRSELE